MASLTTPPQSQSIRRTNKVYVADPRNKRIQVFDSNGKFLTKWIVPEWGGRGLRRFGYRFETVDYTHRALYVNSVLIFDLNGTRVGV